MAGKRRGRAELAPVKSEAPRERERASSPFGLHVSPSQASKFLRFVYELRCYDPGGSVVQVRRESWEELQHQVIDLFNIAINDQGCDDYGGSTVHVRREHWNELKWQIGELLGLETNRPGGPTSKPAIRWLLPR
jgi:hypothetical protein